MDGWKARWEQARSAGVSSLYGFLSAMALWPVVEAVRQGELAALWALGSVAAGVGGNLLANQIQSWKDEPDAALQLARAAEENEEVRAALDGVLERLEVVSQAQAGLDEADRTWFAGALNREAAQLGSNLTVVTVTGSGAAAVGERAMAVGEGGVGVAGDVRGDLTIIQRPERVDVWTEPAGTDPASLRRRYLAELAAEANRLPWASLDPDYADPSRGESLGLADVYTALDTGRPRLRQVHAGQLPGLRPGPGRTGRAASPLVGAAVTLGSWLVAAAAGHPARVRRWPAHRNPPG
jgi:hypothetical protein